MQVRGDTSHIYALGGSFILKLCLMILSIIHVTGFAEKLYILLIFA
jgi:hypothetical protein